MAKKITKPAGAPSHEDAPKVRLICIGRRATTSGKLAFFWIREDEPILDTGAKGLSVKNGFVGKVIDLPMTDDGTYWPGQAAYVKTLSKDDDPRMTEWIVRDRTAFAEDEARKLDARAKRENDPLEELTLGELKERMSRMTHMQRVGMTAIVLRYLG